MSKITKEELEEIRKVMIREFYSLVESENWRKFHENNYYWKWMFTGRIADKFKMTPSKMRRRLTMMEKNGILHCKRESNCVLWCINDIPGFKQHKFADYYQKIPLKELRKKKLEELNDVS